MIEGLDFEDPILGLDIATTTGWGWVCGSLYESGQATFPPKLRLPLFRKFLFDLIEEQRPALIVVEEVFINPRQSTVALLHMHGVMLEALSYCYSPMVWIGNTEAKNVVGGNGKMTAQEKKNGAMVRALAGHGFTVTDGTDAADGLAVALTERKKLFGRFK